MSLRKEMQEMQEWITQAEEDYLERDFQYKSPEELHKGVEELKVRGILTNSTFFMKLTGLLIVSTCDRNWSKVLFAVHWPCLIYLPIIGHPSK